MQALPARLLLPVNSGQGYIQILAMGAGIKPPAFSGRINES